MGKANRKMTKKRGRQQAEQMNQELANLRAKLAHQYADMDYDGVLETEVKLLEHNSYEPEDMYKVAQVYFWQGDYERATNWVTNTLTYAPGHVGARLLLARICLLEDRNEDAMAIYDVILQSEKNLLTEEQQDDIREATDYIVRTDGEWLQENHPLVAKLVESAEENKETLSAAVAANETSDEIAKILSSPVSLQEKIKLLNAYAGGYFINGAYENAQSFLQQAEKIDAHDNMTLRNLAILSKEMGRQEQALIYAGRVSVTDFVLLKQLQP